jgi:hypothetical protein
MRTMTDAEWEWHKRCYAIVIPEETPTTHWSQKESYLRSQAEEQLNWQIERNQENAAYWANRSNEDNVNYALLAIGLGAVWYFFGLIPALLSIIILILLARS